MRSLLSRLRDRVRAHRVRRWARTRLRRGDAVILDTETTDLYGHVIQVSVIDLHGHALMSQAAEGKSLSAYVAAELAKIASRPTNEQIVARLRARERCSGPTRDDIVAAVEAGRR